MQFLVDDLHSLECAEWPTGDYWSTSTGLPYLVPTGVSIHSPETFLSREEYQEFGKAVLDVFERSREYFSQTEENDPRLDGIGLTYTGQFYSALLTICYKGLLLGKWIEGTGYKAKGVIGSPDLARPYPGSFQFGRHEHLFAALAARLPEKVLLYTVPKIDSLLFRETFDSVPPFDKFFNTLNRTISGIAYKGTGRVLDKIGSGGSGTILIGKETDGIEESAFSLVRRGWQLVKTKESLGEINRDDDLDLSALEGGIRRALFDGMGSIIGRDILSTVFDILRERLSEALAYHSSLMEKTGELVARWSDTYGESGKPIVYLSSGMYSSEKRILDLCLRKASIPVICMDHGVGMGLGLRHDFTAGSVISFSDHYLTFNRETRKLFSSHKARASQIIHEVRPPKIMRRATFRRVQRSAARKYLGINRNDRVLMYVANLAQNNAPFGYGTGNDYEYANFQRELVETFAEFPGTVVVKPYPAHRYADPEQIWHLPLPANCVLAPFGEFRHIRWAADMMLVDICSSTLGWAMGSSVPLIYPDNRSNPLTARAANAASKSLLYIPCFGSDWLDELRDLFKLPAGELKRLWETRQAARRQFDLDYVNGGDSDIQERLVEILEGYAFSSVPS